MSALGVFATLVAVLIVIVLLERMRRARQAKCSECGATLQSDERSIGTCSECYWRSEW